MVPVLVALGILFGAIIGVGLSFLPLSVIVHYAPVLEVLAGLGVAVPVFALLGWSLLPEPARVLAKADMKRHDIVELVTHDNRSVFIPVRLEEGSLLVPVDKRLREKLVLVTTPDAVSSIQGSKSRLVRAIADHPVVLDPGYVSVVVDFRRRYGFENLAELLEADRYYSRKEELAEIAKQLRAELDKLERGEGEYAELGAADRERIRHDLERQLRVYERLMDILPREKPVAIVRGRIWTADDLLGWLGYRLPSAALRQLAKLKETEGWLRGSRIGMEFFTKAIVVLGIVSVIAIVAMLVIYSMGHGAPKPPSLPGIPGMNLTNASAVAPR